MVLLLESKGVSVLGGVGCAVGGGILSVRGGLGVGGVGSVVVVLVVSVQVLEVEGSVWPVISSS